MTAREEAPLLTEDARMSMRDSLAALAMLAEPGARPQIVRSGETSLEGMVRELLRPALAEWLDKNLPRHGRTAGRCRNRADRRQAGLSPLGRLHGTTIAMARPDPALLDPARYPYSCSIETRYRDLDSNLHVNNGAMASLLEEGRVRFHRASRLQQPFRRPGRHGRWSPAFRSNTSARATTPNRSIAMSAFSRIGTSSYDLAQLITQDGGVVVFCPLDTGHRSVRAGPTRFPMIAAPSSKHGW